jgi:glutamate-1-semialdehyde 2,1-aminomutase
VFDLEDRARRAIAHGALTNSKRPECFVKGVYPTHLVKGQGCFVWDAANKRYIDFICGLGSSILGYAHPEVNQAIFDQAKYGATLSLGTALELDVAEKVKEIVPFVEKMRFLKTGSDACTAAVRIARAKTDRSWVLSEGYHGFHDEFICLSPPALGVNSGHKIAKLEFSKDGYFNPCIFLKDVAAVIIEPVITDASNERIEWLRKLREQCTKQGTLLIFDEVITGFRFPKFSVSNFHGIEPDLICLGKAIANGMPLSVIAGKSSIMDCGEWFVSSTFAGETLSLASALKTMTLLQTKYSIEFLWEKGAQFIKSFNNMWPEKLIIDGYPSRGVFKGDDLVKALFWQEACRAGILFGSSFFFNFSHIDVMDHVLNTISDIFTRIKTGSVALQGEMPVSPFAQKQRGA